MSLFSFAIKIMASSIENILLKEMNFYSGGLIKEFINTCRYCRSFHVEFYFNFMANFINNILIDNILHKPACFMTSFINNILINNILHKAASFMTSFINNILHKPEGIIR